MVPEANVRIKRAGLSLKLGTYQHTSTRRDCAADAASLTASEPRAPTWIPDRMWEVVVHRGTSFAALFYRICIVVAVNEQARDAGHSALAIRYNRSSLTV